MATRRDFIRVFGFTGATALLIPWAPLAAARELQPGQLIEPEGLVLQHTQPIVDKATRGEGTIQGLEFLKTLVDGWRPHFSFVDVEYDASLRAYQFIASRWYVGEDKSEKELGIAAVLPIREFRKNSDYQLQAIGDVLRAAFVPAEHLRHYTWNPVTLVGMA